MDLLSDILLGKWFWVKGKVDTQMDYELFEIILQIIAAGVGTLGFSIVFHAPRREWLFCALNGALAWLVYLIMTSIGAGVAIASITATFVITIVSRILSTIRKNPSTVFLIAAIFPLVPGAGIYYTAYNLIMDDFAAAGAKGLETFEIAGGIVLGIIFGFVLPNGLFSKNVEQ